MKILKKILLVALLVMGSVTLRAQSTGPTMEETASWIKNTILAYGSDVRRVEWNADTHNLGIAYVNLIKTVPVSNGNLYYFSSAVVGNFIGNLSTANIVWSENNNVVTLEIYAIDGQYGSTKISIDKLVGKDPSGADAGALSDPTTENRTVARILFKSTFGKDMQDRFTKAMKRLIYLSGGKVVQETF